MGNKELLFLTLGGLLIWYLSRRQQNKKWREEAGIVVAGTGIDPNVNLPTGTRVVDSNNNLLGYFFPGLGVVKEDYAKQIIISQHSGNPLDQLQAAWIYSQSGGY